MTIPYDSLAASTIKNFKPGFTDQIIADSVLLSALGAKDVAPAIMKMRNVDMNAEAGPGIMFESNPGRKVWHSLMYKKNGTVQAYAGHDVLNTTPQDPFTAAEYDWASVAGTFNISYEDLDKNSGSESQIFKLFEGHADNLKISLSDEITDYLLSAKPSASSKRPLGLLDLIQDDPTSNPASGALGGIDGSTYDWWRNQKVDHAAATFGTDQTGTGPANLRKLIRQCTFGRRRPNLLMAGDSAYERLEQTMVNQIRYTNEQTKALANAGFEAFTFKGIPVVREPKIETVRAAAGLSGDAIYALNLNYMKLVAMKRRWFEPSKSKEPSNQDAVLQHVISRFQFTTNGRRYQGVLVNVPAV